MLEASIARQMRELFELHFQEFKRSHQQIFSSISLEMMNGDFKNIFLTNPSMRQQFYDFRKEIMKGDNSEEQFDGRDYEKLRIDSIDVWRKYRKGQETYEGTHYVNNWNLLWKPIGTGDGSVISDRESVTLSNVIAGYIPGFETTWYKGAFLGGIQNIPNIDRPDIRITTQGNVHLLTFKS